jgi:hypothetical protein
MDFLKIFRHKVCIPPRHLQGAVPQTFLQMEDRASPPDVIDRERMPTGV